jgi:hypothetical protein
MKRLTTFTVIVNTDKHQFTRVIKLDTAKPTLAVRKMLNDLQQTSKIDYWHIDTVWVTNTVGNMSLIRDVYDWAKHHDFAEIHQA